MAFQTDPLAEKKYEVLPGLIHKYKNRVLFLITYKCLAHCVFCFRKELNKNRKKRASMQEVVSYIEKHPEINELIFSGGEPLLETKELVQLINSLIRNPLTHHIKLFRIHTRLPIIMPEAVKPLGFTHMAKKSKVPIYLVLHVNHPSELKNPQTHSIIKEFRKNGFIILSHTVFLKGINDSASVLQNLFNELIELGIKPYYIFHCDEMKHTQKYIVPIKREIKIMTKLRTLLSGIAVPTHVIDSATGKGKIPVPTSFWKANITTYKDFKGNRCQA